MTPIHSEKTLESAIEAELLSGGWTKGSAEEYDAELGLFPKYLFEFVQATQTELWDDLRERYGASLQNQVLAELTQHLNKRGTLHVLRNGFKFKGKRIRVAQFRPAHTRAPDVWEDYERNWLVVTRQVEFRPGHVDSIDLVLSLNGFPVATAELKNHLTGQDYQDAIEQYRRRDPRATLFQFTKRALVHFAVDPDEVHMTTRLAGEGTQFIPFNRGHENGKGNPPSDGYKTAYLWERIWARESLLEIVGSYVHLIEEEEWIDGRPQRKQKLLHPRYHQLDAVRSMVGWTLRDGPGARYLAQHSAGSGKTATISWLAHKLANLHDADDNKVFRSVVVVTDRTHLNDQLQEAIFQIESKQGVVANIERGAEQLADALREGKPIVVTTLQTFPFVADKVSEIEGDFAVLIDEAHRSQTGEMARQLQAVLAPKSLEDAAEAEKNVEDFEDRLVKIMESRGPQENLSYYAFTATPKGKTIQVFGGKDASGKPGPHHLYSMRQAIEENFIVDVLRNYTTYKAFAKLAKATKDDPRLPKKKAATALGKYLSTHPHNISQKTEVIIKHFRSRVEHRLGGKAKAMVATSSRLHAVRYLRAFKQYFRSESSHGLGVVVAFSGTVIDPATGERHTESKMNGFGEKELKRQFRKAQQRILIVADKYLTGFDEPLLHTMYVDKPLSDVRAVQALSRLNRKHPGKDEVLILDFVNDAEDIKNAFRPYYERTLLAEEASPQQLYDLEHDIRSERVIHQDWIDGFARVFYKPENELTKADQAALNRFLDSAVEKFRHLESDKQDEFRDRLNAYVRLYAFLAQIIEYSDPDLEKLYSYGRFLLKKLPRSQRSRIPDITDDVELEYYRLERKIDQADLGLVGGEDGEVKAPTAVGTGSDQDEVTSLSEVIEFVNGRFGTEFTEADRLFLEQVAESAKKDDEVRQTAHVNDDFENFEYYISRKLEGLFADRLADNEEIAARFFNDEEFREVVGRMMARQIYRDVRGGTEAR